MDLQQNVAIDGQVFPVIIQRRRQTRHLRMRIDCRNQIVLSVPSHCSDREALRFVDSHQTWLRQRLDRVPETRSTLEWFEEQPSLSCSGGQFSVRIELSNHTRASYVFAESGAVIVLRVPETSQNVDGAVHKLVRLFARDALSCRLNYHAGRLNLKFKKLSVRDQVGRWGSCSMRRSISLNWRLVLIAPELQDYVILHELAHLSEMNHSNRFWALLDQYDPGRVKHESELKAVSGTVMRVGR